LRLPLGRELLILGVGGVAAELRFSLRQQRFVAREVCVGLRERGFEGPSIECEELLTLSDEVAFPKRDVRQLTGDLRSHGDRGVRLDVANRGDIDRHIFLCDFGRDDGRRSAIGAATASAAATTATAGRRRRAAGARLGGDDRKEA